MTEIYCKINNLTNALHHAEEMLTLARQGYLENKNIFRLQKYIEALELCAWVEKENDKIEESLQNMNKAAKARQKYMQSMITSNRLTKDDLHGLITNLLAIRDLCVDLGREDDANKVNNDINNCLEYYGAYV